MLRLTLLLFDLFLVRRKDLLVRTNSTHSSSRRLTGGKAPAWLTIDTEYVCILAFIAEP